MCARAHMQAHTRGPGTLFLSREFTPQRGTGNLCNFNLLHPSFPAGFLTESLLRGLVVCAGSCRENTIHKVREKQSRKQRCLCDLRME